MKIQLKVKITNHEIGDVIDAPAVAASMMVKRGEAVYFHEGEKELKQPKQTKENKQAKRRKTK